MMIIDWLVNLERYKVRRNKNLMVKCFFLFPR